MKKFDHLLLLGRPAAGKSEFIDFMKKTPDAERVRDFHIGKFVELDDFAWIWEKFVEDNLWEESGFSRLYSKRYDNNFGLDPRAGKLLDFMLVKINHETKKFINNNDFYKDGTLFIEFSRGMEFNYEKALPMLSREIYERAAILYVDVTFEESWRRNVSRYEEKLQNSILAHMVPRETMEVFYKENDWKEITANKESGYLELKGVKVPFVSMNNEPEYKDRENLTRRYQPALDQLIDLYEKR